MIGSLYPGGFVRIVFGEDGCVVEEERLLRNQGRVRDVDVVADGSIVFLMDLENGSITHVTASD
nr:PQQ-dependent sugar dehydrogenase [uncultured Jannaschia sp.]